MGCEHCRSCLAKEFFEEYFVSGARVVIENSYFPYKYPVSKRKESVIDFVDLKEEKCFFLASIEDGGSHHTVNGINKIGFWVSSFSVHPKDQKIPNGSMVQIIDTHGDLYISSSDEGETHKVIDYSNDINENTGCYFIQHDDGEDEHEGKTGAWVEGTYLRVIKKEGSKMKSTESVSENKKDNAATLEAYFKKAGTRSASRATIKAVRKGLLRVLKQYYNNKTQDQKQISNNILVIQNLLDTQIGQAALGILTSYLLTKIPGLNQKVEILDIAEEMAVEGMSVGMDQVIDFGIDNILPEILPLLDSLPGTEEIKAFIPASLTKKTEKKSKPKQSDLKKKTEEKEEIEEVVVGAKPSSTTRTRPRSK